jgi:hypothetical protein
LLIETLEQRRLLSATLTTLVSFGIPGGSKPAAGLIEDANGDFFGTAEYSQASDGGDGTVFEIKAGSNQGDCAILVNLA